jgi:hypothetical protein
MSRLTLVLSLLALAVMQTTASATVVRNLTAGTTVFYDDYEGVTPVSTVPAPDTSDLYRPVASTGTWRIDADHTSQVTNLGTPGAAQGSQYLRSYRVWGGTSNPGEFNENQADAQLTSVQSNPGDIIQLSQMMYLPSANDYADRATLVFSGSAYTTDPRAWIGTDGAGGVYCYDAGWAHLIDTGVKYATDTWQRWDMTYAVGASTFSLKVGDGPTVSGLSAMTPGGVGLVSVINNAYKDSVGGSFYVDAVPTPEPSALVLLSCGLFGLLAYAWRKRK